MNPDGESPDAPTTCYAGGGDATTAQGDGTARMEGLAEVFQPSPTIDTIALQPGASSAGANNGLQGAAMPHITAIAPAETDHMAAMPNIQAPASEQPLVLVVDDEPNIIEFLRYALEDSGYRVVTARDGMDALAEVQRERPNFVLTDLMMPRLDGWELCRRLRQDRQMAGVPLLAMSAVSSRGVDVDAFLPKPFEMDALLDALHRCAPAE